MKIQGKLTVTGRVKNSLNGNPRYIGVIVDSFGDVVSFHTKPDSQLGYTVTNFDGKEVQAEIKRHYGKPSLFSIDLV